MNILKEKRKEKKGFLIGLCEFFVVGVGFLKIFAFSIPSLVDRTMAVKFSLLLFLGHCVFV